ncbi:MAG TPA: hypothetical protein VJ911_07690, partial [Cryomorphaceae bacterium]|nr:hypothetical protein [Cryomorphaceae bacterium]
MQFELTKEFLDELRDAISEGRDTFLVETLEQLHPADIAEVFDKLKPGESNYLFKLVPSDKSA